MVKLFDSQQAIQATGAARIQTWFLYLSNFINQIEYRKWCDNSDAVALLRLLMSSTETNLEK